MIENINKAKFIGKSILRKFVAMGLAVSIGCFGANFCVNAQSDSGFSIEQTTDSSSPSITSNQSTQEDYLAPTIDDVYSCCFNFFCFIPVVFLTIFRIMADIAQGFSPSSKMDK